MRMPIHQSNIKPARSPDRDFSRINPPPGRNINEHGSPTSVVLTNQNHHLSGNLPSVDEIQNELKKLVKRSSNSKATFRGKLTKVTQELRDTTNQVDTIQNKLQRATKQRDRHLDELSRLKAIREKESLILSIRQLHLNILQFCLDSSSDGDGDSDENDDRIMEVMAAYQQHSSGGNGDGSIAAGLFHTTSNNDIKMDQQLLVETKHRLEEIYDMFITSKAKLEICGDNNVIARENALKMQSTAIDLFIAFKTMNHHH